MTCYIYIFFFFFFNDTATTEIYTLSLHDALPISPLFIMPIFRCGSAPAFYTDQFSVRQRPHFLYLPILAAAAPRLFIMPISRCGNGHYKKPDRKSTRLNSSHLVISYAVFCLKKKNNKKKKKNHQHRRKN